MVLQQTTHPRLGTLPSEKTTHRRWGTLPVPRGRRHRSFRELRVRDEPTGRPFTTKWCTACALLCMCARHRRPDSGSSGLWCARTVSVVRESGRGSVVGCAQHTLTFHTPYSSIITRREQRVYSVGQAHPGAHSSTSGRWPSLRHYTPIISP